MVVLILERVPAGLRGELSRWMLEPRAGVFVGVLSGLVRDKLWDRVCAKIAEKGGAGGGLMVYSARTEQGFQVRSVGDPTRKLADYEGLVLVRLPVKGESSGRKRRGASPNKETEAGLEIDEQ